MSDPQFQHTYLQQPLLETADWLYQSSERLAQQLNYASLALMHTLTSGGKVWCAGEDEAALLAQRAATLLVQGQGRERPPLAAVALAPAASDRLPGLAQQVRALGHPGDVWLAFSLERDDPDLREATEAASELDLTLIAFTGEAAQTLGPLLRDTDVWVPLPGTRPDTLFAIAWLAITGLCAAVDTHLLGEDA
ncbi:SIS domain-containing protein [Aquabacterium sp.]|jgi:D-sedoheptulose 7-phosphate isomerase|uniref:SIS domain-containing protein n=1 Tax=Aquabacterium sp. TaxID=1872578 RepID=UPI0025C42928|nr:SIS domain-containing protein [Aquabacterium sp.]